MDDVFLNFKKEHVGRIFVSVHHPPEPTEQDKCKYPECRGGFLDHTYCLLVNIRRKQKSKIVVYEFDFLGNGKFAYLTYVTFENFLANWRLVQ